MAAGNVFVFFPFFDTYLDILVSQSAERPADWESYLLFAKKNPIDLVCAFALLHAFFMGFLKPDHIQKDTGIDTLLKHIIKYI